MSTEIIEQQQQQEIDSTPAPVVVNIEPTTTNDTTNETSPLEEGVGVDDHLKQLNRFRCDIIGTHTREDEDVRKFTVYEIRVTPLDQTYQEYEQEQAQAMQAEVQDLSLLSTDDGTPLSASSYEPLTANTYYVFRRFSDFSKLHQQICEIDAEFGNKCSLPPTSWFYTFSPETIALRRTKFQEMLNLLMSHEVYASLGVVSEFIQQDSEMIEKSLNFFRAKLYQYNQLKEHEMSEKSRFKQQKAQFFVKVLNRTARENSFRLGKQKRRQGSIVQGGKSDETVIQM